MQFSGSPHRSGCAWTWARAPVARSQEAFARVRYLYGGEHAALGFGGALQGRGGWARRRFACCCTALGRQPRGCARLCARSIPTAMVRSQGLEDLEVPVLLGTCANTAEQPHFPEPRNMLRIHPHLQHRTPQPEAELNLPSLKNRRSHHTDLLQSAITGKPLQLSTCFLKYA